MFSSRKIGIPVIEAINVGESSVTCTGETTIHAQQEQLERYAYKKCTFCSWTRNTLKLFFILLIFCDCYSMMQFCNFEYCLDRGIELSQNWGDIH
jgi:hypothetical protein